MDRKRLKKISQSHLANLIRTHRLAKEMSQEDLARALHLNSRQLISLWETAQKIPALAQVLSLANTLEIPEPHLVHTIMLDQKAIFKD